MKGMGGNDESKGKETSVRVRVRVMGGTTTDSIQTGHAQELGLGHSIHRLVQSGERQKATYCQASDRRAVCDE